MMSIFSVARAPGLPLVYSGVALIGVGVAWMFYLKPYLVRRQAARALAAHRERENRNEAEPADAVPARAWLPSPLRAGPELDSPPPHRHPGRGPHQAPRHLRARDRAARAGGAGLRLRDRGRPRPRRVGAGDAGRARALAGGADRQGDPRRAARGGGPAARQGPLLVPRAGRARGLPEGRGRGSTRSCRDRRRSSTPSSARCSTSTTRSRHLPGVCSGEALHIVPHPDDPRAAWFSLADLATRRRRRPVQRVKAL